MTLSLISRGILSAGLALSVLGTGCATKKYVRTTVAPVDQRVASLEKKTTDQGNSIESIETDLSRTKEKVNDVDGRTKVAQSTAEKASAQATQANSTAENARQAADGARQVGEKAMARADVIEKTFESSRTFNMVNSQNVLFPVGSSKLTADGKAMLDSLAPQMTGYKHYVVEIEGFTDKTGGPGINIPLSQARADAVARYLNVNHKVPLRSIHILGVGQENPVADNSTRNGRKQNRRVEIRLYVPENEAQGAKTNAQLLPTNQEEEEY
jgi:OmpA-OmpF porin, OOP family